MKISNRVMLHSVHILFGRKYDKLCKDIRSYVAKYGDGNADHYFTAMLCVDNDDKLSFYTANIVEENRTIFTPGIEEMFTASFDEIPIVMPNKYEYLRQFFSDIFSKRVINIGPGEDNRLSVCLYIPLFETTTWSCAKQLIESTIGMKENIMIDLFLLPPDLEHIFKPQPDDNESYEEQQVVLHTSGEQNRLARELIRDIVDFKKLHNDRVENIIIMQNYNSKGFALDLDYNAFVRIAGEYILMTMIAYNDIFNINLRADMKSLKALGISVLSLDKYDYVQFMLHRAYLYIMDRENINQNEVHINKLSLLVQNKLENMVHIFTRLFEQSVLPMINEGKSHDVIAAEIDKLVHDEIEIMTNNLQEHIYTDDLSLPEKRAFSSLILGEDDPLLTGQLFNKDLLEMDDCAQDVMGFLVESNNNLLSKLSNDVPENEFPEHMVLHEYAALSSITSQPVNLTLQKLKKLRIDIRRDTEYIRKRQAELERIEKNIKDIQNVSRVLKDGGFEYGDTIFKVVQEIEQKPFELTYVPLETLGVSSADLRCSFTSIKSQGPIGACTSFAFTSVYEYILNKNGKLTESDLSERFLYYNTRKQMGTIQYDSGSNIYDAAKAIEEYGLCSEEYCNYSYDFEKHIEVPTAEAYADGLTRKVAETKNVVIKEHDIKSAIIEGYPVIISLLLHESFNNVNSDGFVRSPEESDPSVGWHSMVIVGFSDKDRVFIVRNSWGTDFGDKGYCYIPYSYVLDNNQNSMCCIVTKISSNDIEVKGNDNKLTVQFDESNSIILSALLRIKIDYTKQQLSQKKSSHDKLYIEYASLIENAKVASNRDLIEEGTQKRLEWEKAKLTELEEDIRQKRSDAMELYRKTTNKIHIVFILIFLLIGLVFGLIYKFYPGQNPFQSVFFSKYSYFAYFIVILIGVIWGLLISYRRRGMKILSEYWDEQIESITLKIQKRVIDLNQLRLKFHLAGGIIDKLTTLKQNLTNKLHSMKSFSENLTTWYDEESKKVCSVANIRKPFISIIDGESLNEYFTREAERITQKLRLYNLFKDNYEISDESIIAFKYLLKDSVVKLLFNSLKDFNVFAYISGSKDYPYLDRSRQDISELLKEMDFKSEPFVRFSTVHLKKESDNAFTKTLFLKTNIQSSRDKWDEIIASKFGEQPTLQEVASSFKMTLIQMRGLSIDEIYDFSNKERRSLN